MIPRPGARVHFRGYLITLPVGTDVTARRKPFTARDPVAGQFSKKYFGARSEFFFHDAIESKLHHTRSVEIFLSMRDASRIATFIFDSLCATFSDWVNA